ncbi:MAG: M48 family metallopeptidase [Bdellovibrionales bacterium]|nr:M48 family metallopeptidase [Bdellovibrionales bacterium]
MKKVFAVILLLAGCATSPTGRSQMMLLPNEQVSAMGVQSFNEMKTTIPIEKDPRINTYVKCIADLILESNRDRLQEPSWEVVVFRSKDVNAFALPGGKIGVYTGILPVAKTANQLAAVMGHEVGHVIARHGNERVSTGLAAQGALMAADVAFRNSKSRGLIMGAFGLGAQYGVILPHSRTQESEADVVGLELMARAGFDPRESVALWQNMGAAAGGSAPPEWMSTHPSSESRIKELQGRIPGALPIYEGAVRQGRTANCKTP